MCFERKKTYLTDNIADYFLLYTWFFYSFVFKFFIIFLIYCVCESTWTFVFDKSQSVQMQTASELVF